MRYDHSVKINGKFYSAGEDAPAAAERKAGQAAKKPPKKAVSKHDGR